MWLTEPLAQPTRIREGRREVAAFELDLAGRQSDGGIPSRIRSMWPGTEVGGNAEDWGSCVGSVRQMWKN